MTRTFEQIGEVIVDGEPGHVNIDNVGAEPADVALALSYRGPQEDTATVAQLHIGLRDGIATPDGLVTSVAIELTIDTLRDLATRANGLADMAQQELNAAMTLWVARIDGPTPVVLGPFESKGQGIVGVLEFAGRNPGLVGGVVTFHPLVK